MATKPKFGVNNYKGSTKKKKTKTTLKETKQKFSRKMYRGQGR